MAIFNPSTFTGIHTDLSILALIAGIVVVIGLLRSERLGFWTALFIAAAVLTSATGFGFASPKLLPSHYVAIIALAVLVVASLGRYGFHLAGSWRWVYAVSAVASLYFLVFVAIAQAFAKIPALHLLAPTQAEPPFAITQLLALAIFVVLAIWAARAFRPGH